MPGSNPEIQRQRVDQQIDKSHDQVPKLQQHSTPQFMNANDIVLEKLSNTENTSPSIEEEEQQIDKQDLIIPEESDSPNVEGMMYESNKDYSPIKKEAEQLNEINQVDTGLEFDHKVSQSNDDEFLKEDISPQIGIMMNESNIDYQSPIQKRAPSQIEAKDILINLDQKLGFNKNDELSEENIQINRMIYESNIDNSTIFDSPKLEQNIDSPDLSVERMMYESYNDYSPIFKKSESKEDTDLKCIHTFKQELLNKNQQLVIQKKNIPDQSFDIQQVKDFVPQDRRLQPDQQSLIITPADTATVQQCMVGSITDQQENTEQNNQLKDENIKEGKESLISSRTQQNQNVDYSANHKSDSGRIERSNNIKEEPISKEETKRFQTNTGRWKSQKVRTYPRYEYVAKIEDQQKCIDAPLKKVEDIDLVNKVAVDNYRLIKDQISLSQDQLIDKKTDSPHEDKEQIKNFQDSKNNKNKKLKKKKAAQKKSFNSQKFSQTNSVLFSDQPLQEDSELRTENKQKENFEQQSFPDNSQKKVLEDNYKLIKDEIPLSYDQLFDNKIDSYQDDQEKIRKSLNSNKKRNQKFRANAKKTSEQKFITNSNINQMSEQSTDQARQVESELRTDKSYIQSIQQSLAGQEQIKDNLQFSEQKKLQKLPEKEKQDDKQSKQGKHQDDIIHNNSMKNIRRELNQYGMRRNKFPFQSRDQQ